VAKDEGAEVGSSAAANAIGDPMTTKHERFTKSHHDAMEVHGFDLLAQVEAMLRHVREYNARCSGFAERLERDGRRLRIEGHSTPRASTSHNCAASLKSFGDALTGVEELLSRRARGPAAQSRRQNLRVASRRGLGRASDGVCRKSDSKPD